MDISTKIEKARTLNDAHLVFSVDLERNKLTVEGDLLVEYEAEKDEDKRERPHILLRDEECLAALDKILPDNDLIVWTNPRATFRTKLLALLEENIV